jgi:hypothetical protein
VDWATTSESFRKIIEQDKVVVQAGEGQSNSDCFGKDHLSVEIGKADVLSQRI